MKKNKILCYGDSNTYGYIAENAQRFPKGIRWPKILQANLGDFFHIIEEGYNGRTIHNAFPHETPKNGLDFIESCLDEHNPIDMMIIYLGINDLFIAPDITVEQIGEQLKRLITIAKELSVPQIHNRVEFLIIAPTVMNKDMSERDYYATEIEKSKQLPEVFEKVASAQNCHFLDSSDYIQTKPTDGVHLDAENQIRLGKVVAEFVTVYIFKAV